MKVGQLTLKAFRLCCDPIEGRRVTYWNMAVNTSEEVEVSSYIFRTSN